MKMDMLPAETYSEIIGEVINENPTVIICGETGSGKSTIIPQIVLDQVKNSCIAVTQPRRVAASSLAYKVAHDRKCNVGDEVGYKFRFENKTTDKTRLTYITDGMLLKEYANDDMLKKYSYIFIDEVHERSLSSDILMWCLRKVQLERSESRRPLKLILMSATMDLKPLKDYFKAEAYYIPGRLQNVELFYCDDINIEKDDHVEYAVQTIMQLHDSEPIDHAFLVFLTGQEEIEATCKIVKKKLGSSENARLIPFYAQRRRNDDAKDIFRISKNSRKIIVATNIAETSITIPDVRIVIDAGKVKQKHYMYDRSFSILEVKPISQAQAIQRAGRAGRVYDGKCFRLYSKEAYNKFESQTIPEILRTNLSEVLLNIFAANINSLKGIKFLDNPSEDEWAAALDELMMLELIETKVDDSEVLPIGKYLECNSRRKLGLKYYLSELGQKIKRLPLSPMLARFLACTSKYGCIQEGLIVAAFCSTDDFLLPHDSLTKEQQQQHEMFLRTYASPEGDHLRLVNIFRNYKKMSMNTRNDWCQNVGLNFDRLEEILEIRKQLRDACTESNIDFKVKSNEKSEVLLKKAIADSFYLNTCVYSVSEENYKTIRGRENVTIHPSSCLFRLYPTTVVYTELIRTKKVYMRLITPIDRTLLEERLKSLNIQIKGFQKNKKPSSFSSGSKSFVKDLKNF